MSPAAFSLSSVPFPTIGALAVLVILLARVLMQRARRFPFPPGPLPDFLVGNVRQMGSQDLKVLFEQWGRKYGAVQHREVTSTLPMRSFPGSIVYASAFGKPLIVLNSFEVARDLLQKRGSIYSSRPRLVTFSEM